MLISVRCNVSVIPAHFTSRCADKLDMVFIVFVCHSTATTALIFYNARRRSLQMIRSPAHLNGWRKHGRRVIPARLLLQMIQVLAESVGTLRWRSTLLSLEACHFWGQAWHWCKIMSLNLATFDRWLLQKRKIFPRQTGSSSWAHGLAGVVTCS